MKRKKLIASLVTGLLVFLISFGIYSYSRIPLDLLTVYATDKDTSSIHQYISLLSHKRLSACPHEQYKPRTSPLSFLVAAMDSERTNIDNAREIFYHYLKIGCDINSEDDTGLTPLHSAILFKNPTIIVFLLENGADPKYKLRRNLKHAGKDSYQYLNLICSKDPTNCQKLRAALKIKNE